MASLAGINEVALIDLAVGKNDQRAFAELVQRHQSKLRYSLRQLTNFDEALADDLAQETFIKAFKQLHRFKKEAKFSSWIYRIGYNTFLEYARKKKLDVVAIDEAFGEGNEPESRADDFSTNRYADGETDKREVDLQAKVAQLLAALEPERRSVLHLLLHRQFTQQEIATTMSIPLGTVKTHINRGRLELQKGLNDWRA